MKRSFKLSALLGAGWLCAGINAELLQAEEANKREWRVFERAEMTVVPQM